MLISVTLQFQCGKTCFPVDFPFPSSKFPRKHPFFEVPFELKLNPTTNDSRGDYSRVTCMHGIIFAVLFSCFALFEHFVQFHEVPWQIYDVQELTDDVKERTWSYPYRAGAWHRTDPGCSVYFVSFVLFVLRVLYVVF